MTAIPKASQSEELEQMNKLLSLIESTVNAYGIFQGDNSQLDGLRQNLSLIIKKYKTTPAEGPTTSNNWLWNLNGNRASYNSQQSEIINTNTVIENQKTNEEISRVRAIFDVISLQVSAYSFFAPDFPKLKLFLQSLDVLLSEYCDTVPSSSRQSENFHRNDIDTLSDSSNTDTDRSSVSVDDYPFPSVSEHNNPWTQQQVGSTNHTHMDQPQYQQQQQQQQQQQVPQNQNACYSMTFPNPSDYENKGMCGFDLNVNLDVAKVYTVESIWERRESMTITDCVCPDKFFCCCDRI